jgi:MFS family permease
MALEATRIPLEPAARWARVGTAAIFFLNGVAVASWAVRIPAVREALELSKGTLGLVLLAAAVGSLVSMPVVGRLCSVYGSRRVTLWLSVLFALCAALPALSSSVPMLVGALFLFGATNGGLDVAMNTQATSVERAHARPILSSFHALWSVGSLIGAAIGGVIAGAGVAPGAHLLGVAAVCLVAFLIAARTLIPDQGEEETTLEPVPLRLEPVLLALGAVAFCALLGEGAVADWSAVYLRSEFKVDEGLAAVGFVAFQFSMAALRFLGDGLRARLGDAQVLGASGWVAGLGLGAALLVNEYAVVVAGFALVGMGLAVIFPAALGLVSQRDAASRGPAIAWVSAVGYSGFLVGPPLIGLVAEVAGLRLGLGAIAVAGVLIAVLAGLVRPKTGGVSR